ncbi:MAG: CheR family methyltransferase [Methanoculleaceae archaeon]
MAFTYFFRDLQTLETIIEYVLPVIRTRRYINIWSAGCAMGQEPYTIAFLLKENMGPMIFRNVKIYATDIDQSNQFGRIIAEGSYPEQDLKRIPREIFSKYFSPDPDKPGYFKIAEEIRKRVEFQKHDLLSFTPVRDNFSLIVCKNVLLHFSEEDRIRVIRMFHNALDDKGFLITEHTQKMPGKVADLFEQVSPKAQIFRKVPG